jgi:hypothetical protein
MLLLVLFLFMKLLWELGLLINLISWFFPFRCVLLSLIDGLFETIFYGYLFQAENFVKGRTGPSMNC